MNVVQSCTQLTEIFAEIKAKFPLSCDRFRLRVANIRKLFSNRLFMFTEVAAYANIFFFVCLFVTKI